MRYEMTETKRDLEIDIKLNDTIVKTLSTEVRLEYHDDCNGCSDCQRCGRKRKKWHIVDYVVGDAGLEELISSYLEDNEDAVIDTIMSKEGV